MKPFVIRFGEWHEPDFAKGCYFRVKRGELLFPVAVEIGFLHIKTQNLTIEKVKTILPKVGLDLVLRKLDSGDYPDESTRELQKIDLAPHNQLLFDEDEFSRKFCKFQTRSNSGSICKVSCQDDPRKGKVSQPLCEQCTLPDSRFLCSDLSHPSVTSQSTGRVVEDALCEKGQNPGNASQCIPGGEDCWELIYEPTKPVSAIPNDLAERVADEIDFLNLAFKGAHGSRVLPIHNARSISDLHSHCQNAEEFMTKVAVVADLINQLSVAQLLPEEQRGEVGGTINALNLFIERNYPGQGGDLLQNLKLISKIRNSFPIHSRTEGLLKSFDSLDIDYPPENWHLAWEKVLHAFWLSLKQLRRLVMITQESISGTE